MVIAAKNRGKATKQPVSPCGACRQVMLETANRQNSPIELLLAGADKGEIPQDFDKLTSLPGVGRKTANVILAVAFGKSALAVDTHVYRVSRRVGLVPLSCNTPKKVELELLKYIPENIVSASHFWILMHGRYVCKSRKPDCENCGIREACKYYSTHAE